MRERSLIKWDGGSDASVHHITMAPVAVEAPVAKDISSLKQQVNEAPPLPKWQEPPLTKQDCES